MSWSLVKMTDIIKSGFVIFSQNNTGIYSVSGNGVVAFNSLHEIPLDVIFISNSKTSIVQFPNIKRTNFYGTSIQSIINSKGLTFASECQAKDLSLLISNITISFVGFSNLDFDEMLSIEYASDAFVNFINNSDKVTKLNVIAPPGNVSLIPLCQLNPELGSQVFDASFDIFKHSKYMFSSKIPTGNWMKHDHKNGDELYAKRLITSDKFKSHSFVFTIVVTSVPTAFYEIIDISENGQAHTVTGHAIKFLLKNKYKFNIIDVWSSRSIKISSLAYKLLHFSIPKTSSIFIPSDIIGYLSVSVWKSMIFIKNTDNYLVETWLNDWNNIVLLNSFISTEAHNSIKISKISNNKISLIANKKTAPFLLKKLGEAGLTPNPNLISFAKHNT